MYSLTLLSFFVVVVVVEIANKGEMREFHCISLFLSEDSSFALWKCWNKFWTKIITSYDILNSLNKEIESRSLHSVIVIKIN